MAENELRAAYDEVVAAIAEVYADLEQAVEETLSEPPPGWAGQEGEDHGAA